MKHKDIYEMLKTLDVPVAYDHFDTDKNVYPPFIAYREITTETFKADNITFFRPYEFEIEVVTEKKDLTLLQNIENLFTTNKIPFDVGDEVWDEQEKIYHNYYEI